MTSLGSRGRGTGWAAGLLVLALVMSGGELAQAAPEPASAAAATSADAGKPQTVSPASPLPAATASESAASAAARAAAELERLRLASALPAPSRVGITLAIIALMGGLFYVLFKWQHQIEQSDFFSGIYTGAVERFEFTRLTAEFFERWERGDYLKEIFLGESARGRAWVEQVRPRPTFQADLIDKARELAMGWEIDRIERSLWALPDPREGVTVNPFAGGSRNARPGLGGLGESAGLRDLRTKVEADAHYEACRAALHTYDALAEMWVVQAKAQAWDWYQADLAEKRKEAAARAKLLLNVDFSALRGRGPEFVLEFTAVVVIIFAAVILGVLGVLDSNQIGTLLAAIAGYVLGKGTTRNPAATAAPPAALLPAPAPVAAKAAASAGGPAAPAAAAPPR